MGVWDVIRSLPIAEILIQITGYAEHVLPMGILWIKMVNVSIEIA